MQFSKLTESGEHVSHILTDFMMPRLNGVQMVEQISHYVKHKNNFSVSKIVPPRIYFLTAHKTSHFDKFLEKLNVESVFEKPLSLEQVASIFGIEVQNHF